MAEAHELLVPEDFYKESHRKIFQVLVELYAGGKTADPVVLAEELKRRGQLRRSATAPTSTCSRIPLPTPIRSATTPG